jgi:hypothetical protein
VVDLKKLLLLLIDAHSQEKTCITPTLAWLAKEEDYLFDSYISSDLIDFLGLKIDGNFFSGMHAEQLYYVCNIFDICYCSYGSSRRFLKDLQVFDKKCVTLKTEYELVDFYLEVFNYFGRRLPRKAVMLETASAKGQSEESEKLCLDSYCYPEIYYQQALGLSSNISADELNRLKQSGVTHISTFFCRDHIIRKLKKAGFKVVVADKVKKGDTYGSVTSRIADRWLDHAKGFAFGDHQLTAFWIPFFCRKDLICLYDSDWKRFSPIIASYVDKKKSRLVWGLQSSDDLITELSKFDIIMQIVTHMRPLLAVRKEATYPFEWSQPPESYWELEISDSELTKKAKEGNIASTILIFAENLCHFGAIPRIFELSKLTKMKIGIASNTSWYEFAQSWMEDTLIPVESGGCFPLVEPLICSAGLGAGTEAKSYLSGQMLLDCLVEARRIIGKKWGKKRIPLGYYPWQDANPYYRPDTGKPQFRIVKEAGFQYYVTCKDMNESPKIVFQDEDFIVINQQNSTLDLSTLTRILTSEGHQEINPKSSESTNESAKAPWSYDPLGDFRRWERRLMNEERPGWIIISLDSPFWGWSPFYFERGHILKKTMEYIMKGGRTGKLFTASPHEAYRYARILESEGVL